MKYSRWTDHLPAWLAYGAVATTGIYEPWEVAWMAVPLLAAAGVEAARLDLGRWRRWLQTFVILVLFLEIPILRRQSGGFLSIVVHLLFMLMGLRLALPRELPQRRQLLLMGFLLFLTTAISTADLEFMAWAAAWALGSSIVMLQQAWEPSALLRRGPTPRPPYARSLRWTLACLIMAAGFFVFLPRISLGLRPLPWSVSAFSGSAAGLSDSLDLGRAGRIAGNSDIVMRIQPPQGMPASQIPALADRLALLRGVVLEELDGAQWKRLASTPRATWSMVPMGTWPTHEPPLEMTFEPSTSPILALPYGDSPMLQSPRGVPLSAGSGSAIRWAYQPPGRQYLNLFGLKGLYDRAGTTSDAVAGLSPDTTWGSTRGDAERPKGAGGPPSLISVSKISDFLLGGTRLGSPRKTVHQFLEDPKRRRLQSLPEEALATLELGRKELARIGMIPQDAIKGALGFLVIFLVVVGHPQEEEGIRFPDTVGVGAQKVVQAFSGDGIVAAVVVEHGAAEGLFVIRGAGGSGSGWDGRDHWGSPAGIAHAIIDDLGGIRELAQGFLEIGAELAVLGPPIGRDFAIRIPLPEILFLLLPELEDLHLQLPRFAFDGLEPLIRLTPGEQRHPPPYRRKSQVALIHWTSKPEKERGTWTPPVTKRYFLETSSGA